MVTPRDVAEGAREFDRRSSSKPSPADQLPQHYDEIIHALTAICQKVDAAAAQGVAPPRVLLAGECSGVGARLFRMAGADVATCSYDPTETPWIPHFQGDMQYVLDLGWDLILGFPSCTFLSNAGLSALYNEPERFDLMVHSAADFRRAYDARAPFVAMENPVMHRFARQQLGGLEPSGSRGSMALAIRSAPVFICATCQLSSQHA